MLEHNSHENSLNSSKILAAMRLEKLKKQRRGKKRIKREFIEIPVPVQPTDLHVAGSTAWAPLDNGTVRLVKRYNS